MFLGEKTKGTRLLSITSAGAAAACAATTAVSTERHRKAHGTLLWMVICSGHKRHVRHSSRYTCPRYHPPKQSENCFQESERKNESTRNTGREGGRASATSYSSTIILAHLHVARQHALRRGVAARDAVPSRGDGVHQVSLACIAFTTIRITSHITFTSHCATSQSHRYAMSKPSRQISAAAHSKTTRAVANAAAKTRLKKKLRYKRNKPTRGICRAIIINPFLGANTLRRLVSPVALEVVHLTRVLPQGKHNLETG